MRWWWLSIVVLFPAPARPSEEPKRSTEAGQTKHLQEIQDGVGNQTELQEEKETNGTWVTQNSSQPSDGGHEAFTATPLHNVTIESSTEYTARTLAKPTITIRSVNGTCNVSANCAVTGGGDVSYIWLHSGTNAVLSSEPTLQITKKPPDGFLDYTCAVRNKESESSRTVSLKDHCQDPSSPNQGASLSFYAKYLIPPLIVLVMLVILFFMYRRKRGMGTRSRTVSINESLDSDDEDRPDVVQTAQQTFPPGAFRPIPEETLQTTEALTSNRDEETLDSQDLRPSQT